MKKILFIIPLIIMTIVCVYTSKGQSVTQTIGTANLYEIPKAQLLNTEGIADYSVESYDITKLNTLSDLTRYIYAVDKKTGLTSDLFNIKQLLSTDVTVKKSVKEPKVLIFHTHGNELFADSKNTDQGIMGAGEYLAQLLEKKYGVKSLHVTEFFDMENAMIQRNGAYERMEPYIQQILKDNPSIELVIDLHRDGVNEGVHLVKSINGKKYARFMFFNGLCKKWENGELVDTVGLSNPYLKNNLALSLKMQLKTDEKYPGITRKIYLNAYRYSLHLKPRSMLIELGAQTNTTEEAFNSVEILAEIINEVVLK